MYPSYGTVDVTAVMGKRFGAWLIDIGIAFVLFMVLFFSLATRESYASATRAQAVCNDINGPNGNSDQFCIPVDADVMLFSGNDALAMSGVALGFLLLNDIVLTGLLGFSIGKGIVGLRVVRQSDGRKAGLPRAALRSVLWVADGFPWCVPLVGLITANSSAGHRRVGDMAAGTLVIDKAHLGQAPQVPGLTTPKSTFITGPYSAPGYGQPSGYGPPPGYGSPPGYGPPPGFGSPPGYGPPPGFGQPPAAPPPPAAPAPGWGPAPVAPPAWGAPPAAPSAPGAPGTIPPWAAPQPPLPQPPSPQPTWQAPAPPASEPTVAQPVVDVDATQAMPVPAPAAHTGPGLDAPMWDDDRDTYIQWDPDISRWVQWDETNRTWNPI